MSGLTLGLALANLLLGAVYTSYGFLTLADMRRAKETLGFTHFGAAWVAMSFTCGPHHLVHGVHLAFEGRPGGLLDLLVVVVGIPIGAIWVLLRIEAFAGGRGDRFVTGTPRWLSGIPLLSMGYLLVVSLAVGRLASAGRLEWWMTPNLALVGIYMAIGYLLIRVQLRNRRTIGGWSVSGLSLAAVFPTCALTHYAFVAYASTGVYEFDGHGILVDTVSVPAGLYFLWVVGSLYLGRLRDWNRITMSPPIRVDA